MSLTFATLKTEIIQIGKRSDLTSRAARYIAACEGLIARQLRAREMITRTTVVEGDRVSEGIYDLPADFLEERVIRNGDVDLEKRSLRQLRRFSGSGDVHSFAILGGNDDLDSGSGGEIEFRAVPGTDASYELIYFGLTRFSDDADDNALLVNHEDLYIQGGLAFLYQDAHELELADASLQVFNSIVRDLNAQAARYWGGTTMAPAGYNLGISRTGGAM